MSGDGEGGGEEKRNCLFFPFVPIPTHVQSNMAAAKRDRTLKSNSRLSIRRLSKKGFVFFALA